MVSTMKMVDTKKGTLRASSGNGVRVNRTGRRTYPLQYKLDVVRQCCEPGVSVAGVALAQDINANLVRRWIVRQQHAAARLPAKPDATLLPVTIEAAPSGVEARVGEVEASTKRRRLAAASIE